MQNSPANKICPSCGGTLVADVEPNYCPACVLRHALQPTESELAAPALDLTQSMVIGASAKHKVGEADLAPGSRFGDYRIRRRLGHGGMGVVYEADQLAGFGAVILACMAAVLFRSRSRLYSDRIAGTYLVGM